MVWFWQFLCIFVLIFYLTCVPCHVQVLTRSNCPLQKLVLVLSNSRENCFFSMLGQKELHSQPLSVRVAKTNGSYEFGFLFLGFLIHHIFYIAGRLPCVINCKWWYFLKWLKTLSLVSPKIFPLHVHSLTGQVCASQTLLFAASFHLCWWFKLSMLAYLQFCYGCSDTFQLPEQEPPEGICQSLNY